MPSHTAFMSTHQTIAAANTAETITLTGEWSYVEVLNRDATATLYFVVGGGTATVGGDNTYAVPPNSSLTVPVNSGDAPRTQIVVSLISSGTAANDYVATTSFFGTVTSGDLTATAGIFVVASSLTLPTTTSTSCYFVDVDFS